MNSVETYGKIAVPIKKYVVHVFIVHKNALYHVTTQQGYDHA